jgi:hypothetical protein
MHHTAAPVSSSRKQKNQESHETSPCPGVCKSNHKAFHGNNKGGLMPNPEEEPTQKKFQIEQEMLRQAAFLLRLGCIEPKLGCFKKKRGVFLILEGMF